jgi:four helix bundle protein
MQDYRRLFVWRRAHIHVLRVRRVTDIFPDGHANLKKQLTKSVESIAYNIVEGSAASTRPEFARFLEMSIKSSRECEYQLLVGKDYGAIAADRWRKLHRKNKVIRKMLWRLRQRVLDTEEQDNSKPKNRKHQTGYSPRSRNDSHERE